MPTLIETVVERGGPKQTAILVPDGPAITYGLLRDMCEEAALALRAAGVIKGDRVAIVYPNGAEAILLFLAASSVAVACPLNPAYKEDEFRFYLEDTGARFIIVPPGEAAEARRAMPQGGTVLEAKLEGGRLAVNLDGRGDGQDAPLATGDDVALVLHTSGTTSRPKRVPLLHRNLTASIANVVRSYDLGPEDVSMCVMPLFHVHGLVASALATLASGGTVVVPEKFNAMSFWPLMQATRPTWFTASPTPHSLILGRLRENRPPGGERLRFVRSCSSALAPAQMALMEERLGVPVLEAYGMTEASHQMASNPLPPQPRVPGSVGKGTGVDIAILDEAGRTLPAGASGEVCVRGPNVTGGYENNPQVNASSFVNGWFRTGDLGVLDAGGYLRLLGRIKEQINRGGEKISPREVDEVLEAHPAVAEAVTFGVPHPTWGEEVAAVVVLSGPATEKELLAFCRTRLADFKVPKRLHMVESIPKGPTGKVQRRYLTEQFKPA
jgi:acyl-CoA synthetase (AMP-forming)/AMP-acid ligase II